MCFLTFFVTIEIEFGIHLRKSILLLIQNGCNYISCNSYNIQFRNYFITCTKRTRTLKEFFDYTIQDMHTVKPLVCRYETKFGLPITQQRT